MKKWPKPFDFLPKTLIPPFLHIIPRTFQEAADILQLRDVVLTVTTVAFQQLEVIQILLTTDQVGEFWRIRRTRNSWDLRVFSVQLAQLAINHFPVNFAIKLSQFGHNVQILAKLTKFASRYPWTPPAEWVVPWKGNQLDLRCPSPPSQLTFCSSSPVPRTSSSVDGTRRPWSPVS